MKIRYIKLVALVITMAFTYTSIEALDCTGVDKEGIFYQSKYEEGLMTPEEAKCWTTYIEEQINWDIDYWDRFDSLNRFDLGYHTFTYEDIRKIFTLGEFPRLKTINIRNFCSGRKEEFPSVVFENSYLKNLFIGESHFKRLPESFYEYGDSLEVLSIMDNHKFNEVSEKINQLTSIVEIVFERANIFSVPKTIQELKTLELLHINNDNTFPDIPDMSFEKVDKFDKTLHFHVSWDYKQGCLDTMPVIVKEGTDSVIKSLTLTCIKNFPDNKAYLQSFQANRPSIFYIDVTNQKSLPVNLEYLVIIRVGEYKHMRLINPHRLRSLKVLSKTDIDRLTFYMTSGPLLSEDFERLINQLTQLKQLKRVSFEKGVPLDITDNTKQYIKQLNFLESIYFEDINVGKELEMYLPPGIIRYRN